MAVRLERSGGLILIRGTKDEPEEPKRDRFASVGLWLALILLVVGVMFIGPSGVSMADVGHAFKSFLAAVR
jgi:hypothetical protein